MENLLDSIDYKGYAIKLYLDEDPEDPRNWDTFGKMICWHNRYNLGDKHSYSDPEDLLRYVTKDNAVILPLFLYDHSGITMSTVRSYPYNCLWDSMQVGYIYATFEDIKKEFGAKRISKKIKEKALDVLLAEVKVYDQYIMRDVYGYVIEDSKGEEIDSCWGFYGNDATIEEAKSIIDSHILEARKVKNRKLKRLIINNVPLNKRTNLLI